MTSHRRNHSVLFASTLALTVLAGCDFDSHPTATGKVVQPPETTSPTDAGTVNAGGPGAQGKLPK